MILSSKTLSNTSVRLLLLHAIKALLSLYLVTLSASYFGTSTARDAWVVAWAVQLFFFKAIYGPVLEVLRAYFLKTWEDKGEAHARKGLFSWMVFSSVIAAIVVAAAIVAAPAIIALFVPGIKDAAVLQEMTIVLCALIPILVLSNLNAILNAVLNTYKVFAVTEMMALVSVVFNIVLIRLFAETWGIYVLVIAAYLSAVLLLVLQVYLLHRKNIRFHWGLEPSSIKSLLFFAAPLYVLYGVGQFSAWVERSLASYLDMGSISALDYARKFLDMPLTLMLGLSTSLLVTQLAATWATHRTGFYKSISLFYKLGSYAMVFLFVLFTCCNEALVRLLLVYGSFDKSWVQPIAKVLFAFGWGLPATFLYIIAAQALIAQGKTRLYSLLGILAQLIPVVINFIFLKYWGLSVFAWSWTIAQYITAIVMLYFIYDKKLGLVFPLLQTFVTYVMVYVILAALARQFTFANDMLHIFIQMLFTVLLLIIIFIFVDRKYWKHNSIRISGSR